MELRSGSVFFDMKQSRYLFMRLFLKNVEVKDCATPFRQLGNKCHQLFFGQLRTSLSHFCFIWNIGKLFFIDYQIAEFLFVPSIINGL